MARQLLVALCVLSLTGAAFAQPVHRLDAQIVPLETRKPTGTPARPEGPSVDLPRPTALPTVFEPGTPVHFRGAVSARSWVAFRCGTDTGDCVPKTEFAGVVPEDDTLAALDRLPSWLAPDVALNLNLMDAPRRADYAALIARLEDERIVDEVGFLVAHLSPQELSDENFDPQFLVDNAAGIYAMAELFDYARLIEVDAEEGGTDGPWTTVELKYRDADGETYWERVPRTQYYWNVLHPRLDAEGAGHVDPAMDALALPPDGVFWRDYFPHPENFPVVDYRSHMLWNEPEIVTAETLSSWGPSAVGHMGETTIDPLVLATDAQGLPVALELRTGRGVVLATTLRVEAAAAAGTPSPLHNMVKYGPGDAPFRGQTPTLVLRDDGAEISTLAAELDGFSFAYTEVNAEQFADAVLDDFAKIIVAENAPAAVWQALAARGEEVNAWLSADYRILEIHGATEAEWDTLPAELTRLDTEPSNDIALGGWPGWWDAMEGAAWVWDDERRTLPGDRFLDSDAGVLDRAGYWVSQTLADNVSERADKRPYPLYPFPYRAQHAERIANGHYGNCGELQDLLAAASRTALIPVRNVSNSPEDHVWNQFWHAGEWHSFQVSWSDMQTEIANPAVCYEKLHGGGKDISFVYATGGNGRAINVTSHYSETASLDIALTDAAGAPVDGAFVLFATEAYYPDGDEYPLLIGFWDWTDAEGRLHVDVGDAQNIYLRVLSPVGSLPVEENRVAEVVPAEEGLAGATFDIEHEFTEAAADILSPCGLEEPVAEETADAMVEFSVRLDGEVLHGEHPYNGFPFAERDPNAGQAEVMLLSETQYRIFLGGEWYDALQGAVLADGDLVEGSLPIGEEAVYLVVAAPGRYALSPYVEVDATLLMPPEPTIEPGLSAEPEADAASSSDVAVSIDTGEGNSSGGNSGCTGGGSQRGQAPLPLVVLLLVLLGQLGHKSVSERQARRTPSFG